MDSTEIEDFFREALLTVELVPATCWFSNLRSILRPQDWDTLRKRTYRTAHYVCEVCGGRGPEWPVECHERWSYDDLHQIQKLVGLISLCPDCHQVKHLGLAGLRGQATQAEKHLAKVNGWTAAQTQRYLAWVFRVWEERSQFEWSLDLSWLEQLGFTIIPPRQ